MRAGEFRCLSSRTASTASPVTRSLFAQVSGAFSVEEKTTLGIAVSSASPASSGASAANPDISRYVVAPMSVTCSSSDSLPIHPRCSGPSIHQEPGHPSAAA